MRRLALLVVLGALLILAFGVQPVLASDISTIVIHTESDVSGPGKVEFTDWSNGTEPPPNVVIYDRDGDIYIVPVSYIDRPN